MGTRGDTDGRSKIDETGGQASLYKTDYTIDGKKEVAQSVNL